MKILLIHPPIRTMEPPRHIPFGLGQIASVSDSLGMNVAVLDMNANRIGLDAFRQEIRLDDWDVVGIGALSSQYQYIKPLLPIIKKERPNALIVAGGGFLTTQPVEMLRWNREIDVGCVGESENTWVELLDVVYSRRFNEVRGLVYRDERGKIKLTEPRPLIGMQDSGVFETLDDLPYPAYDLLPMNIYLKNSQLPLCPETMHPNLRRLSFTHERGCPYNCVTADTEIIINVDSTVEIEDFVYNPTSETVLGVKSGKLAEAKVLAREAFSSDNLIEITTEEGCILKVTKDNLVKTKRGWLKAEDLVEGDEVSCI